MENKKRIKRGRAENYREIVEFITYMGYIDMLITTEEDYNTMLKTTYPSNIRLKFKCNCGEIFTQAFAFFKTDESSKCCKKCSKLIMREKFAFSEETIVDILKNKGYILISKYINALTTIEFYDSDGYFYESYLPVIQKNKVPSKFNISNKYTIQNIKLWCKKENKNFILLDNYYVGNEIPLQFKCTKEDCGEIFDATWSSIHNGSGCPYCCNQKVSLKKSLYTTHPEIAKYWDYDKNPYDFTPLNVTFGSEKRVWWRCDKDCTHSWNSSISGRIKGGCPQCSGRSPSESNNLLKSSPKVENIWSNKNKNKPEDYTPRSGEIVWWKCENEKHDDYERTIQTSSQCDFRCPSCVSENKSSFLQTKIRDYLHSFNYRVNHEDKCTLKPKNILIHPTATKRYRLKYDNEIIIDDKSLLIECHGIQHYEITGFTRKEAEKYNITPEQVLEYQQQKDKYKKEYALSQGYHFLEIPYWTDDKDETWKQLINEKIKEIKCLNRE